jgi:hypothetical protein
VYVEEEALKDMSHEELRVYAASCIAYMSSQNTMTHIVKMCTMNRNRIRGIHRGLQTKGFHPMKWRHGVAVRTDIIKMDASVCEVYVWVLKNKPGRINPGVRAEIGVSYFKMTKALLKLVELDILYTEPMWYVQLDDKITVLNDAWEHIARTPLKWNAPIIDLFKKLLKGYKLSTIITCMLHYKSDKSNKSDIYVFLRDPGLPATETPDISFMTRREYHIWLTDLELLYENDDSSEVEGDEYIKFKKVLRIEAKENNRPTPSIQGKLEGMIKELVANTDPELIQSMVIEFMGDGRHHPHNALTFVKNFTDVHYKVMHGEYPKPARKSQVVEGDLVDTSEEIKLNVAVIDKDGRIF